MLYEFAITPDAFAPDVLISHQGSGLTVVQLLYGLASNGLLASLDQGRWQTQVHRLLDSGVGQEMRGRLLACLELLDGRNRIIRHGQFTKCESSDDLFWLRAAIDCDAECPLTTIFATDDYVALSDITHDRLVELSQALECTQWRTCQDSRTRLVQQTESNYRDALAPFLRYARKVHLIDPYLTPRLPRFQHIVDITSECLRRRGGSQKAGLIEIHAGDPERGADDDVAESPSKRLDEWKAYLAPLVRKFRHKYRVYLWRRANAIERNHDRYVVTDQSALAIPGGLDCHSSPSGPTTSFNLQQYDDLGKILAPYSENQSPFKLLGKREVLPGA